MIFEKYVFALIVNLILLFTSIVFVAFQLIFIFNQNKESCNYINDVEEVQK